MSDKYEFNYSIQPEVDFSTQEITLKEVIKGYEQGIMKQIIATKEKAIRQALTVIGWMPPEEVAALQSENDKLKERPDKYTIARIERLTSENDKLKQLADRTVELIRDSLKSPNPMINSYGFAVLLRDYEDFKKAK